MWLKCPFQLVGNDIVDINLFKESYVAIAYGTTCGTTHQSQLVTWASCGTGIILLTKEFHVERVVVKGSNTILAGFAVIDRTRV